MCRALVGSVLLTDVFEFQTHLSVTTSIVAACARLLCSVVVYATPLFPYNPDNREKAQGQNQHKSRGAPQACPSRLRETGKFL